MSTPLSSASKLTIESLNNIVTNLKDPIRGYIFIEVLRNPEITANDLKHRMKLKGSKIYFHINKLVEKDILEYTGVEEFEYKNQNLSRKKIKLKDWILNELVINNKTELSDELIKIIYTLQLNLSIAVLEQQIRNLKQMTGKTFTDSLNNSDISLSVFSFVDQEIVAQISSKITELVETCNSKYIGKPLIEVMKECSYGVISGIFSF
jgi:predicted transcriptional regulator